MRRRNFIKGIASSAAAWPLAARAQQSQKMRRIGVMTNLATGDPEDQSRNAAFLQGLQPLGWTAGGNVQIDYRWGAGNADRNRQNATDLVALGPDVILATGNPTLDPLLRVTRTIPIVFVQATDPVGAGYVSSLARPGGNATGFLAFEYGTAGKLLEVLKEVAPNVKRVAILRDSASSSGIGMLAAIQSVAPSFGVEFTPVGVRDIGEIERTIADFARQPNGGMVVTESGLAIVHRHSIIALAARYRLPAVYGARLFAADGGLVSYGADSIDPYRRAAGYVARILKGEKPADLPVQEPTKFELVVNLKTAKELGLVISPTVLGRADEVIE